MMTVNTLLFSVSPVFLDVGGPVATLVRLLTDGSYGVPYVTFTSKINFEIFQK